MRSVIARTSVVAFLFLAPIGTFAQTTPSFKDVPESSVYFSAVEYLKSKGVISGYSDGTFQPERKVNRAEALKIIVAPLASAEELSMFTWSVYSDVPAGSWYLPYAEHSRQKLKIIDGPPAKTAFYGDRPVTKTEFLKMLLLAQGVDPNSFNEIRIPLATDVPSADEWYYPYLRYSITASMTMVGEDGLLGPGRELTRGQVALLLYRFVMYRDGRRTQALLSETESEIVNILRFLEQKDIAQADFASGRAMLAARGALASRPDDALVKGALKTAEGFRSLVQAYQAGTAGKLDDVLSLTGEAWRSADSVRTFAPTLAPIADQIQAIAKGMADEARNMKAQVLPQ